MKPAGRDRTHLTYCTNIHPGETWAEVRANLSEHVVAVKNRIAPDVPFGVGLRLSGRAAAELDTPAAFEELAAFLESESLYVFTINGFPHGSFHGTRVKEDVYRPDWLEPERLDYTNRLASLLARLLPDEDGLVGSVSSVPVAFRPRIGDETAAATAAALVLEHTAFLHRLRESSGKTVTLALEPEPCCHMETTAEAVAFFETHLFCDAAITRFAELTGLGKRVAEDAVRRHVGVCLDTCHAAVEFEDADESLARLDAAGVQVGKMQLSCGLVARPETTAAREELRAFADDVYLHQVVADDGNALTRYVDLPEALAALEAGSRAAIDAEWRIHFHVPLFRRRLGSFANTQPFLERILHAFSARPFTTHLEVETYTWDVLPAEYRDEPVVDAIARELRWVLERLAA